MLLLNCLIWIVDPHFFFPYKSFGRALKFIFVSLPHARLFFMYHHDILSESPVFARPTSLMEDIALEDYSWVESKYLTHQFIFVEGK